jgi:hypothetical protein
MRRYFYVKFAGCRNAWPLNLQTLVHYVDQFVEWMLVSIIDFDYLSYRS